MDDEMNAKPPYDLFGLKALKAKLPALQKQNVTVRFCQNAPKGLPVLLPASQIHIDENGEVYADTDNGRICLPYNVQWQEAK